MLPFRCSLVLLAALAVGLNALADGRRWVKTHQRVEFGSEVPAEWTRISVGGVDHQFPRKIRYLYRDNDTGHRLVIRYEVETEGGPEVWSVTSLETGETLALTIAMGEEISATLGSEEYTLTREECEGHSGPLGTECPEASRTAAATFIGTASQEFRSALSDFTSIGCTSVPHLYGAASRVGFMFFPDQTGCTNPPQSAVGGPTKVEPDFDPQAIPPDEFDQLFGAAYYE